MGRVLPNYGKGTHERFSTKAETITWRDEPFKQTVKCVCKACNTGWMSDLEDYAKPYLEPPLLGRGIVLFAEGQRMIARWAFKTALMIACGASEEARPVTSYWHFYERGLPSPETRIWIGTFFSSPPRTYQTHVGLLGGREPPKAIERANGYLSTFAVGHLAFHVLGSETGEPRQHRFGGKLGRTLVQVWPVHPIVRWPPELFVTPGDLDALTNSFGHVPFQ
jgi:hypothetical protein